MHVNAVPPKVFALLQEVLPDQRACYTTLLILLLVLLIITTTHIYIYIYICTYIHTNIYVAVLSVLLQEVLPDQRAAAVAYIVLH